MELKLRKTKDTFVIDVIGEVDLYNTNQLKDLFNKMLEQDLKSFIINLDQVTYIDSSGIGTLITIYSTAQQKKIKMVIANVKGTTKKVLELTRLEGFFPISDSIESAMMLLKG